MKDFDVRVEVDAPSFDALNVRSEPDETVTGTAASVGFDKSLSGDVGVRWLDPNRSQGGRGEFDEIW